jgi:hypothetical protein
MSIAIDVVKRDPSISHIGRKELYNIASSPHGAHLMMCHVEEIPSVKDSECGKKGQKNGQTNGMVVHEMRYNKHKRRAKSQEPDDDDWGGLHDDIYVYYGAHLKIAC